MPAPVISVLLAVGKAVLGAIVRAAIGGAVRGAATQIAKSVAKGFTTNVIKTVGKTTKSGISVVGQTTKSIISVVGQTTKEAAKVIKNIPVKGLMTEAAKATKQVLISKIFRRQAVGSILKSLIEQRGVSAPQFVSLASQLNTAFAWDTPTTIRGVPGHPDMSTKELPAVEMESGKQLQQSYIQLAPKQFRE